ncbi:RDD family protein [Asanoa sp. NPDC050611]|uniref:RDD family protein n=1 Tax=Asanoa sp. NPDC050611 TaxID=3157098 RepID=UPI0033DAD3E5
MTEPPAGPPGAPVYGTPYPPTTPFPPAQQPHYGYAAPPTAGAELQPYVPAAPPVSYGPPPYPVNYPLVSAGGRLGAALLDSLLGLITLGIGWLVWSLVTWSDGQTPAKKLLGHVVVDANTGERFDWGRMALRELCIKGLLGWLLNIFTCSVWFLVDSFMIFGDRQRTLHDRMANSVVRHG